MAEQTKKRWMTTDDETETEVRSKNTPAITAYHRRCRERQRNENLPDYNFNFRSNLCSVAASGCRCCSHLSACLSVCLSVCQPLLQQVDSSCCSSEVLSCLATVTMPTERWCSTPGTPGIQTVTDTVRAEQLFPVRRSRGRERMSCVCCSGRFSRREKKQKQKKIQLWTEFNSKINNKVKVFTKCASDILNII